MKPRSIVFLVISAVVVAGSTQLSVFLVPPSELIPNGVTLLISRLDDGHFIDSADATCERSHGGVSLVCRRMVFGAVGRDAVTYLRLPYSDALYRLSTGGKVYDHVDYHGKRGR